MKLKKIASLALAGVMAISMLAGCSNKPAEDSDKETVTGVTAEAVIASLDKEVTDKVTFTYSSSLESTLNKAVQYVGTENIASINREDLTKFDTSLDEDNVLYANKTEAVQGEDWYKKAENNSITRVVVLNKVDYSKYTDAAVVEALAKEVNELKIAQPGGEGNATQTAAELVSYNNADFGEDGSKYYYTFKYTGTMAVTKVVGNNGTSYVVALTVTRVPSKTATPTKG